MVRGSVRHDDLTGSGDPALVHVAAVDMEVTVTYTDMDVKVYLPVHAGDAAVKGSDLHGHVKGLFMIDLGACIKEAHAYMVGGSKTLDAAQPDIFLFTELL